MSNIIDDNFMVCVDCISAIANDDYTGLDFHYDENESQKRELEIRNGINEVNGYIVCGDSVRDSDFSTRRCDCCGSTLHGARYHCVVFSKGE